MHLNSAVGLLQASLEYGYLLNRVWVDGYCIWIQQQQPERLGQLAAALEGAWPTKECVGWPLAAYEELAASEEDAE